jgi:anti-sigma regulatory factor (Ser/Thr protein kinase)
VDLIQPQPQPLPCTLAAPGLARRYLASRAATWPAGLLDLVELLASEVVTNAVLHGRGPVELLLNDDGTRLKVEVGDGLPGPLPWMPGQPVGGHERGRGLLIVDYLADRWGCRPHSTAPGKIVWFELRYPTS